MPTPNFKTANPGQVESIFKKVAQIISHQYNPFLRELFSNDPAGALIYYAEMERFKELNLQQKIAELDSKSASPQAPSYGKILHDARKDPSKTRISFARLNIDSPANIRRIFFDLPLHINHVDLSDNLIDTNCFGELLTQLDRKPGIYSINLTNNPINKHSCVIEMIKSACEKNSKCIQETFDGLRRPNKKQRTVDDSSDAAAATPPSYLVSQASRATADAYAKQNVEARQPCGAGYRTILQAPHNGKTTRTL